MYRENVAPPPPDPLEEAKKNARHCGYLQLFMAGMNAVNALAIFTTFLRIGRAFQNAQVDLDHQQLAEWRTDALLVMVPYVVVMGVWAGLNHWGLGKRSKIAFYSSVAYGVASLPTCFSIVMVIALYYMLFKKEMKGFFQAA